MPQYLRVTYVSWVKGGGCYKQMRIWRNNVRDTGVMKGQLVLVAAAVATAWQFEMAPVVYPEQPA